jgi:hypothetical protein
MCARRCGCAVVAFIPDNSWGIQGYSFEFMGDGSRQVLSRMVQANDRGDIPMLKQAKAEYAKLMQFSVDPATLHNAMLTYRDCHFTGRSTGRGNSAVWTEAVPNSDWPRFYWSPAKEEARLSSLYRRAGVQRQRSIRFRPYRGSTGNEQLL